MGSIIARLHLRLITCFLRREFQCMRCVHVHVCTVRNDDTHAADITERVGKLDYIFRYEQ